MRHKTIILDLTTFILISVKGSTSVLRLINLMNLKSDLNPSSLNSQLQNSCTFILQLFITRSFCTCVLEAMIIIADYTNRLKCQTKHPEHFN